eukprot:gene32716-42364_t
MRIAPTVTERRGRTYELNDRENFSIADDYIDFNTVSFQSTSTLRTISESFKAHAEKSLYQIPSYILTDRMNVSTTLNKDDFNVKKVLSRNNRCEVYSANIPFCPTVVIKKATTEAFEENTILNEIQILTKLKHNNIIAIRGARVTATEPFIVLEELGGGTLSEMIEKRRGGILPCGQALDIARQLACALQHLQEDLSPFAMIIHRDLHPGNIGFTSRGQLKLFDFGNATLVKKRLFRLKTYKMTNIDGNNLYMAPEAVNNLPYNEKVDIYSFGVILRLLLTGIAAAPPPPVEEEEETVSDTEGSPTNARNSVIEPDRALVSTPMQLLIDQCTVHDYYLRPSSVTIQRHLRDELVALAQSYSISGMVLRWGVRQGRAITKGISRAFRAEYGN